MTFKSIEISVFVPYHGGHSLHGLVLLVHTELGQAVGTFVLELRAQPCAAQTLIPCIRTSERAAWVPHHPHLGGKREIQNQRPVYYQVG